MITYSIAYEIRNNYAEGRWLWIRDYATTNKGYQVARDMVFNNLHANGYETRGGGIGTMRIESIL